MKNILEFTACIIEVLIAFIYFNGVLDRKENIGKLFYCFFGVAVILNISRTILLLSFSVNICITVILWLFIAILCFEKNVFCDSRFYCNYDFRDTDGIVFIDIS